MLESNKQYRLFEALRPFSLVVAVVACSLGVLLAFQDGAGTLSSAFWVLTGGVLSQAGVNLINDLEDIPLLSGGTNRRSILHRRIRRNATVGYVCFIAAAAIGLYFIVHIGLSLVLLILLGAFGAIAYNVEPFNFKRRGLAIILVFFLMGVLMVQGAYLVIVGHGSVQALLDSIPVSFMVSLLLLSNELRDYEHDRNHGVKTLTVRIGFARSKVLYWLLIGLAYLFSGYLYIVGSLQNPMWLLAPLPMLLPISRLMNVRDRKRLTPMTGRLFFAFGLAYMLAVRG